MDNIQDQEQSSLQHADGAAEQSFSPPNDGQPTSYTPYEQPTEANPPADGSNLHAPVTDWHSPQGSAPTGGPYGAPYPPYQAPYGGAPYVPVSSPPPTRSMGRRALYGLGALLLLCAIFVGGLAVGRASAAPATGTTSGTLGSGPTVNVPSGATDLQSTIVTVVKTVQPSVVEVTSQGGQGEAIGSGEILTKDGYIVTNDHVVAGFNTFSVTLSDSHSYSAQLVGQDAQDDLAVLKVSTTTTLQPINFADSNKVQVGQFAIAIGTPLGLQQSATFGIISALDRTASEAPNGPAGTLTGLIQTSAPINPGNSGGALVSISGQLIGIPTLGAQDPNSGGSANGIGFAIPSNRVQYVSQQLIQNGHLVNSGQGYLGIRGEDVTSQLASAYNLPVQQGVLIAGFVNDSTGKSPAQAGGLKTGDIITAVDGATIANSNDLGGALESKSPGSQVTLTIYRGSSQQQVKVTLGERPANAQG